MKKFNVESRRDYTEIFDNCVGDYIEAESKEEAIEFYKEWLIENGCGVFDADEVEEYQYRATEVE